MRGMDKQLVDVAADLAKLASEMWSELSMAASRDRTPDTPPSESLKDDWAWDKLMGAADTLGILKPVGRCRVGSPEERALRELVPAVLRASRHF